MKYFLNILDLFYLLKAKIIAQITQKSRMKKDRDLLSSLKNKNGGGFSENNKNIDGGFWDSKFKDSRILNSKNATNYEKSNTTNKNILLCEVNCFHLEILDSIIYYFTNIGFSVDILLRKEMQEKIQGEVKNTIYLNLGDMLDYLNSPLLQKYDFVFFNTMILSINVSHHILKLVQPKSKYGILGIYHTIGDIKRFDDYKYYKEGRYFALREYNNGLKLDFLSCSINMESKKNLSHSHTLPLDSTHLDLTQNSSLDSINPHHTKLKTHKNIFLSIGHPIYHRNFRWSIYRIISTLKGDKNTEDFAFIFIGRSAFRDLKYSDSIYHFTNPSPSQVSEILRLYQPKFMFGLYDSFAHRHYLRECTSGMRNFSLMHNIPFVIDELFGESFGFSKENAILFKNPLDGIKTALEMPHSKYLQLKENLSLMNDKLTQKSLKNLKIHIAKLGEF